MKKLLHLTLIVAITIFCCVSVKAQTTNIISGSYGPAIIGSGTTSLITNGASFTGAITNNGQLLFNQSSTINEDYIISGSGGVTQLGSGTTILTGGNTYSGVTKISAGALQIGNGGVTGSLGFTFVTNNGILIFDRSDTISLGDTNNISIGGTGSLQQIGSGTLVLTIGNTYAGTTTINGGTIQIGNGRAYGTLGNGSVTNNGSLAFNRSDSFIFSNAISGTGSVFQNGSGSATLSASNTFGGPTIVSAGTLVISATGSLAGSGTTTVNSAGTLQNKGLIAGTTTVNGTLAGNGGTFGSLKINGGSGLIWDISSLTGVKGTGWDALNTTNLDLSGMSSSNKVTIYIYGGTGAGNASPSYTFNFLSATNTFSGFNMSNFTIDTSNFLPSVAGTWSIGTNSISGGGEALSLVYAVPEPSTYALLGLGTLGLIAVMRRKFV